MSLRHVDVNVVGRADVSRTDRTIIRSDAKRIKVTDCNLQVLSQQERGDEDASGRSASMLCCALVLA